MVFTRWPREDSFPVSRALARTCQRLSRFDNILLQDLTPLHVKITRSTNFLSYNYILSFLNARSQLVWVLASSGFYKITWRTISRSAGSKIHFRIEQPPFRGNLCPLSVCYLSFPWIYAPRPRLPCFHTIIEINNLKTFTLTTRIEIILAISLSLQKPRCFNVILHLNEMNKIKKAVVIRNYSSKSSPFIQRRGNLLCQWTWENHGNSCLTSTKTQVPTKRKNHSRVRVCGNRCNTE